MSHLEFSYRTRKEGLERLAHATFDVLLIGGGITGAGIARDAAMRGLEVALVERGDFASGTSSKSSRLIHGGFRYLATGDLGLVFQSCRERHIVRRIAPRLVQPLEFLYPFFESSSLGLLWRSMGLWVYDGMAFSRNVQRHRMLKPQAALELEPGLRKDGLSGAALYYDCLTNDFRLTLATLQSAFRQGAVLVNYAQAVELRSAGESFHEVILKEQFSGEMLAVRARVVVNAAGPWVDQVRRLAGAGHQPALRPSKGTHLILPRERVGHQRAVVFHAVQDRRVLFAIPFGPLTILGTTETAAGEEGLFGVASEVEYLLKSANRIFPDARLEAKDVWCTYSGLRPLLRSDRPTLTSASREHRVVQEPDGMISVCGGKLTTYRAMAEEVVDLVVRRLEKHAGPCRTAQRPLDEGMETAAGAESSGGFSSLAARYGPEARIVEETMASDARWRARIVPSLPYVLAEVPYVLEHEMALTLEDLLVRRIPLLYEDREHGLGCVEEVAALMGEVMGWSESIKREQVRRYCGIVESSRAGLR